MSCVIIRLQNLPLTASSLDIRNFFNGLAIPDGGVHIVGGPEGDAFIAFSSDEDARQAMQLTGKALKDSRVSLLLSSRNEMYKVIELARVAALGTANPHQSSSSMSSSSGMSNSNVSSTSHMPLLGSSSSTLSHSHSHSHSNHQHNAYSHSISISSSSNAVSPPQTSSGSNDYPRGLSGSSGGADLSSNPALLFSTMAAIPSATLGGSTQGGPSAYLSQQSGQHYQGMPSNPVSTTSSGSNAPPSLNFVTAPHASGASAPSFPSGNPFLIPPPGMHMLPVMLPNAGPGNPMSNNPPGLPPATANPLGLSPSVMSSSMSMGGQPPNPINPFANPPPRMTLMGGQHGPGGGSIGNFGPGMGPNGPRPNAFQPGMNPINNFGLHQPHINLNRPPPMQQQLQQQQQQQQQQQVPQRRMEGLGIGPDPRGPFGQMFNSTVTGMNKDRDRFQPQPMGAMLGRGGAGGGGGDVSRDIMRERRSRSRSKERRPGVADAARPRHRSRSRDRGNRNNDREKRRRRSKSSSRSRSRDRTGNKISSSRRESRDKREERRKSDSSPEKSSQDKSDTERRSRRDHEPSPVPNGTNTTTDEWPGAKLTGIPGDASYREIKEFIRAEVMGGSDGVVRLYEDGVAFLKLENPSEFPRVFRNNGRKLRGSSVLIEGITMEVWTHEYKLNKTRLERDIDREKEERERERDRDPRRDRERDRSDRHNSHTHNSHPTQHRLSRFSNASQSLSTCVAIRGLAATITRQELLTRYLQDTPCSDVVLIAAPTPTNRHSVTAFVQFESAHVAQHLVDTIARSPIGAALIVESCGVDDLQKAKARTSGSGGNGGPSGRIGGERRDRNQRERPSVHDAKSIFDLDVGLDEDTTTVIMKGAPPNITERDVFDFYSDIGLAPMNVRIMYDTDGQCSGQVICEFQDDNKAKRATTKDGMLFGRGQISVSLLPTRSRSLAVANRSDVPSPSPNDFGQAFMRNMPRASLLGTGPRVPPVATGANAIGLNPSPRFPNPSSPNIFEQALQLQTGPTPSTGTRQPMSGGARVRGPSGERMSRFNSRSDFRTNGVMGRGVGRNGDKEEPTPIGGDDMALFSKQGCVLSLENIPYKASMDDILQYLEDVLKIRILPDRIIRRYDDHQKATGDARVAFDTAFEAKLACERIKGTYMWTRLISADIFE